MKGERGLEPVFRGMELVPFEETPAPYDTVLVKPNLITSHTFETGITTDPVVAEAVIMKVMELGKRAIVVETEGGITSPDEAIVDTGMMEVIERLGSEWVNMGRLDGMQVEPPLHPCEVFLKTVYDISCPVKLDSPPFADAHGLCESDQPPNMVVVPVCDEDVVDFPYFLSLKLMFYVGPNIDDCGFFAEECK
jgi:hypothetical protein